MKALSILLTAVVLSVASFAQTTPSSSDPDAQALIEKSKAVIEAVKSKDPQALNGLLAQNFRTVDLAGDLGTRQEMLGAAQGGFLKDVLFYNAQAFRVDNDSVVVSYNSAVTLSDAMLNELADDNLIWPRYSKVSDLWVRQNGEWKLAFEQITPVRAMY